MLEPVGANEVKAGNMRNIIFRDIVKDEIGKGVCYVRDGRTKMSRIGSPFITLYLQDITGVVVPGYVFNLKDFQFAGKELTQLIHNLAEISYEENYFAPYGMSIRVTDVKLLTNPPTQLLSSFVGNVDEVNATYNKLMSELSKLLNMRVNLPYSLCTQSHIDYSQGKVGGLAFHYSRMLDVIKSYAPMFEPADQRILYGCFLLFIHAHNNYIAAELQEAVDISLSTKLTASIAQYITMLKLPKGAAEVSNIFFGYKPKDIFVRLVCQASEDVLRAQKEIAVWSALPLTREGDAGYGTIRRY